MYSASRRCFEALLESFSRMPEHYKHISHIIKDLDSIISSYKMIKRYLGTFINKPHCHQFRARFVVLFKMRPKRINPLTIGQQCSKVHFPFFAIVSTPLHGAPYIVVWKKRNNKKLIELESWDARLLSDICFMSLSCDTTTTHYYSTSWAQIVPLKNCKFVKRFKQD